MREARGLYLFRCKVARILVYSPEVFELMPLVHADYGAVLSLPKVGFNHKASHIVRKLYGLGGAKSVSPLCEWTRIFPPATAENAAAQTAITNIVFFIFLLF